MKLSFCTCSRQEIHLQALRTCYPEEPKYPTMLTACEAIAHRRYVFCRKISSGVVRIRLLGHVVL